MYYTKDYYIIFRREKESREGNGEKHEGLQGAEEGGGGRQEEYEGGGDVEVQEREDNQDQLLQITCWNQARRSMFQFMRIVLI